MTVLATSDLTRWALRVDLPRSPQVGPDRVGRVLVGLVQYADTDAQAWPSAERLSGDLSGLSRRDVRNALEALAASGLITPVSAPQRGRSVRWRLNHDLAGSPAKSPRLPDLNLAGSPANPATANVAGELAGQLAGELAGSPAANRREEKNPPSAGAQSAAQMVATTADDSPAAAPRHPHEANAASALASLKVPLDSDELLREAYRVGAGDPWAGYLRIKHVAQQDLSAVRDPASVLRSRVRALGAAAPVVHSDPWNCPTHGRPIIPNTPGRCDRCAEEVAHAATVQ